MKSLFSTVRLRDYDIASFGFSGGPILLRRYFPPVQRPAPAGAGIFYFRATSTPRATDADQARLTAESEPSHSAISIAKAIQVLSIRH